ncbi:MAG: lipid II flippase MurJ, partial [bacterium]|nr:lipid II flippase MurJ [bacterium]
MVPRFLSFFGKEWHNLNDAALLLSSFALLSQVLALVRDRLFAHSFGASSTLDVYYAAFRIPDFLYVSLASFVSVTVLIPILLEKMGGETEGNEASRKFISDVLTVFSAVILLAGGVLFFFIPDLARAVAPGFSPGELEKLVSLSRILLLSPLLLGVSN